MTNEGMISLLKSDIMTINHCLADVTKNYVKIGQILSETKKREIIEKTNYKGYKNISEFALSEFGFEKSKTYNLISVYEKFFLDKNYEQYKCFNYSQLVYMLSMTDEQLKSCIFSMTVREIKEIKLSTRVESETVANTQNVQKNNVIEGIFPDKKIDEEPEQKQNTIIVTELPKLESVENKTITIEVKSEQNNDFVTNNEDTELIVLKKAYEDLHSQYFDVKNQLLNSQNKVRELLKNIDACNDVLDYVHSALYNINNPIQNDDIDNLCSALYDFIKHNKLPEKLNFYKNVI